MKKVTVITLMGCLLVGVAILVSTAWARDDDAPPPNIVMSDIHIPKGKVLFVGFDKGAADMISLTGDIPIGDSTNRPVSGVDVVQSATAASDLTLKVSAWWPPERDEEKSWGKFRSELSWNNDRTETDQSGNVITRIDRGGIGSGCRWRLAGVREYSEERDKDDNPQWQWRQIEKYHTMRLEKVLTQTKGLLYYRIPCATTETGTKALVIFIADDIDTISKHVRVSRRRHSFRWDKSSFRNQGEAILQPSTAATYGKSMTPRILSDWNDSTDGKLSMCLTVNKTTFSPLENIVIRSAVRNNTDKPIHILRPFGDEFYALSAGLHILGPENELEYYGAMKEYVLGTGSFHELKSGMVLDETLEIPKKHFKGLGDLGLYKIRYKYLSAGYPKRPKPDNFWEGSVNSKAIHVLVMNKLTKGQKLTDEFSNLKTKLSDGTRKEKEEVLNLFMQEHLTELVPSVIKAILDDTVSPRHGDTGWARVHHQAATAMCKFAYRFDGKSQKERGRDKYSFHNDGGVGTEARMNEVHKNWTKWWKENEKNITKRSTATR